MSVDTNSTSLSSNSTTINIWTPECNLQSKIIHVTPQGSGKSIQQPSEKKAKKRLAAKTKINTKMNTKEYDVNKDTDRGRFQQGP